VFYTVLPPGVINNNNNKHHGCVVQTFLTDSPSFKSALRRICWWRRSSRDTEKKLMIQRVINDCSWPPVGESTIAAAHRVDDSEEPLSSLPQTALSSDVSLYSR